MNDLESAAPASGRLEFVDSLRGFALFGVFWANLLIFAGVVYMNDEQRSALFASPLHAFAYSCELFFIENKFMGMFSLLFGVSFWLFLTRVQSRGGSPFSLFYRRIFWLFVIGLVHGWLLWSFDILRFYALWAVLLPLFVRTAPGRLLRAALGACVVVPALVAGAKVWIATPSGSAFDFDAMALAAFSSGSFREALAANWKYDWYLTLDVGQIAYQVAVFGRLLLGLYIARTLDLGNLHVHRPLLRNVLIGGALIGVVGSTVFTWHLFTGGADSFLPRFIRRFVIESGQLGLSLAYASGLALAFLSARGRPVIRSLRPLGQMALTWYLFQTLFGIWMFYGFAHGPALMGKLDAASLVAVCLVGYVAQVWIAHLWLGRFRFGPAEWLWRSLTYWRIQPFKIPTPTAGQEQHAADGAARGR